MTDHADLLRSSGTMGDLIAGATRRYPDRVAFTDATHRITYRELADRIARCARVLRAHGAGRGVGVAQLAGNTVDAWVVQASCYTLGAYFVGLHATGSDDDARYLLQDSRAHVVVIDDRRHPGRRAAVVADLEHAPVQLTHGGDAPGGVIDLWDEAASLPHAELTSASIGEDLGRLAYTGGSTGRPKGVMLPHRSLTINAMQMLSELRWPDDIRLLLASPITHGAGALITPTLVRGGCVHLLDGFDPATFLDVAERERITATMLVPSMIYALLDHLDGRAAPESLGLIVYGASPITTSRLLEAIEVFGPVFNQCYGQTEAPATVTTLAPEDHHGERLRSIGVCCTGNRVALLDHENRPVPRGELGEICVRGPLVMDGYWNRPDETAAAFDGGWLHTGDVAYEDESGYLYIADRKKDMVISGGFNIYPAEVEDAIAESPDIARVAVIGVPDPKWGEALKAIVVPRPGATPDLDAIRSHVRERKGAMYVPKSFDVVDSIPLTPVGKPDKPALRQAYWSGEDRNVH